MMSNCVLCKEPLDSRGKSPLWAEVDNEFYPVCDAECRRLVEDNPVDALGPRVVIRYRKPCQRCAEKIGLWRVAAGQRALRLRLEEASGSSNCPELLIEGEPDPFMAEVDDITDLLNLLYTSYPGFVSCC
jgi:hypothetical protein